jgi:hypothetical protein
VSHVICINKITSVGKSFVLLVVYERKGFLRNKRIYKESNSEMYLKEKGTKIV